jgi:uncharacterized membrane protein
VSEVPGRRLAWRSLPGSVVDQTGVVELVDAPGGGTEVRLSLGYRPSARWVSEPVRGLLGRVGQARLDAELEQLCQLCESGVIIRSEPAAAQLGAQRASVTTAPATPGEPASHGPHLGVPPHNPPVKARPS